MNDNQFENEDLKDKDDSDGHEKEENKKWLIALTVGSLLSIIGIVVSIIAILIQK